MQIMILLLQHGHKDSFFGKAVKRKGDVEGNPSHDIETQLLHRSQRAARDLLAPIYGWSVRST
jgi:hypothetical protein